MDDHQHDFSIQYRLTTFRKNGPCLGVEVGEMCSIYKLRKSWSQERGVQ